VNTQRGRTGLNGFRLIDVNTENAGSYDAAVAVHKKHQLHAGLDQAQLERAFAIDGAVQNRRSGSEAIVGMPGNANLTPTEAFDAIVVAFGLHINQRTGTQTGWIYARRDS
jgi:hypothetical protein